MSCAPALPIPVHIADSFLLALDGFMQKTGQGGHLCQSVLELSSLPDLEHLHSVCALFTRRHPLLFARLHRSWLTWLAHWHAPPANQRLPLPLDIWSEIPETRLPLPANHIIADGTRFFQDKLNSPLTNDGQPFNARFDLLEKRDGSYLLAFTWSHRILDGKGAELLLIDFARLCEGIDDPIDFPVAKRPTTSFQEKIQRTKGVITRFDELAALGVHSLGGPRPRRSTCRFEVVTFSPNDSAAIRARADQITGPLFPLPYFLACATRAHHSVFQTRGNGPRSYVSSVPVQTRKRGGRGPLFHNQVSIFFFSSLLEELGTLRSAATALKKQFAEMTRDKLDASFSTVLELMERLPSWIFMRIVRWQFKGEINSFFFSHTGPFAPEITRFAGAPITNAWHLPCLGTPPGTGVFFNERDGRLTLTLSWRDSAITPAERDIMLAHLRSDLLGEKKEVAGHVV